MKAVVNRKTLLTLIDRCLPATKDGIMGHGKSVLVAAEVDPAAVRVSGVGMGLAVDTCAAAKDVAEGAAVVDAGRLRSLIDALPEGEVTLKVVKEKLDLRGKGRHYTLPTMDRSLFPSVPEIPENDRPYVLPTDALGKALEACRWAMDDNHEHLNGVLIALDKGTLEGVALKGHGTAHAMLKANVTSTPVELFFPARIIPSVLSLCNEQKSLRCDLDSARLYIETDDTLLSVAFPHENFAQWRTILSQINTDPVCALDGGVFMQSVKAMLVAAPQAVVHLKIDPPMLHLTVEEEGCQGEEKLEVQVVDAAAAGEASLNGSYLAAALAHCDIAKLRVTGEKDPIAINSGDGTYSVIIMAVVRH